MNQKTIRKIGFFTALALMTSSIIGVGIFFKNGSISKAVNGEGISWLIVWILAGIISLGAALSFSEIGSMKTKRLIGISNFANQTGGKTLGYFVYASYIYFYLPILVGIISFFVTEAMYTVIQSATATEINFPIYSIVIVSLVLMIGTIFVIHKSKTASGWIAKVTIVLKLIPLVLAIIIGISLPNTYNAGGKSAFDNAPSSTSIQGIILGLPAALFSYDSFLNVASIGKRLHNPKRGLPLVIIAGLSLVITVYTLIGLSGALHSQGTISGVLSDSLPKEPTSIAKGISITVWVFITVSAYGVLNSMCYVLLFEMENGIKYRLIPFASKSENKLKTLAPYVYATVIALFYFSIVSIMMLATNSDTLADGLSNLPTVIFYGFYGIIILLYSLKREKMNTDKINSYAYWIFSVIAMIGIALFVVSYPIIVILEITDKNKAPWGGFFSNGFVVAAHTELIVFILGIGWVLLLAFLSALLTRITEKHCPIEESNKPLEDYQDLEDEKTKITR